jgi:hypothetical protein
MSSSHLIHRKWKIFKGFQLTIVAPNEISIRNGEEKEREMLFQSNGHFFHQTTCILCFSEAMYLAYHEIGLSNSNPILI